MKLHAFGMTRYDAVLLVDTDVRIARNASLAPLLGCAADGYFLSTRGTHSACDRPRPRFFRRGGARAREPDGPRRQAQRRPPRVPSERGAPAPHARRAPRGDPQQDPGLEPRRMGPISRQVRRPHARLPLLAFPPAARRGAANASRRRDANASRSPAGARPTSRSPRASRGPFRSTPASGTSSAASTTRSAGPTARALRGPSTTGASRRGTTPAALRQTYPSDGEKKKKQARRPARKGGEA